MVACSRFGAVSSEAGSLSQRTSHAIASPIQSGSNTRSARKATHQNNTARTSLVCQGGGAGLASGNVNVTSGAESAIDFSREINLQSAPFFQRFRDPSSNTHFFFGSASSMPPEIVGAL